MVEFVLFHNNVHTDIRLCGLVGNGDDAAVDEVVDAHHSDLIHFDADVIAEGIVQSLVAVLLYKKGNKENQSFFVQEMFRPLRRAT
jgi:hypothetical protein